MTSSCCFCKTCMSASVSIRSSLLPLLLMPQYCLFRFSYFSTSKSGLYTQSIFELRFSATKLLCLLCLCLARRRRLRPSPHRASVTSDRLDTAGGVWPDALLAQSHVDFEEKSSIRSTLSQVLPVSSVTSGDSGEDKRQTLFHRLANPSDPISGDDELAGANGCDYARGGISPGLR